ncbi:MAG: hypothetical protein R3A51_21685 [Nannocystaceae bacterium]
MNVTSPRHRGRARRLALMLLFGSGCSAPGSATAEVAAPEEPASVIAPTPAPEEPAPAPEEPAPEPAPPVVEVAAVDGLAPLTDAQRQQLGEGAEDPPIPVDIHYVQSNETRHDLFFPYIEGVGGAYVGVGSDQNFTMLAKARSEFAFLMDIDHRVVGLHKIYAALIPKAEGPDDVIHYFHRDQKDATAALLEQEFAALSDKERRALLVGFKGARETVYRHLLRVKTRRPRGGPVTWLSDPAMFAHIKKMHAQGRIRVMSGDLTGPDSLQTVARACGELGVPVAVLYMSNAEEFFDYTPGFVANIKALPGSDDAVILRTIYSKKWPHADLWSYQVQPLADLKRRLDDRKNSRRRHMLRWVRSDGDLREETGQQGLTLIALEPAQSGGNP